MSEYFTNFFLNRRTTSIPSVRMISYVRSASRVSNNGIAIINIAEKINAIHECVGKSFSKTQINTVPTTNSVTVMIKATTEQSVNLLGYFVIVINSFSFFLFLISRISKEGLLKLLKELELWVILQKAFPSLSLLSCETHDGLDVGGDSKRPQNGRKIDVEQVCLKATISSC